MDSQWMDYSFVDEILREFSVPLRNYLSTLDTLAYLKYFTLIEVESVRCILQNNGRGPANDELINIVRIKPDTFIGLLASMKADQHHALFGLLWNYIQQRLPPEQVNILHQRVTNRLESHQIVARHIRGEVDDEHRLGNLTWRIEHRGGSQTEILSPPGSTPRITTVRSNSSSAISFTAEEEKNLEDKELNDLDMTVIEVLAKELEKTHEDGKANWEHVLKDLKLKYTITEKTNISRSPEPGVTFLELLGEKRIIVRQLKEAFHKNSMQKANQILFWDTGAAAHKLPMEILRMDNKSVELFKKALEDGKERDYNIRIMVVGPYNVGKTALTKRLLCQDLDIDEKNSTDGIDVHVGKCKVSLKTLDWTVDSAGSVTNDDNSLNRLAKILGSTSKTDTDESKSQNLQNNERYYADDQEKNRTNKSNEAFPREETVDQNQNAVQVGSTALSDYIFKGDVGSLNDGKTMNRPLEQHDLLMKDLKEVVEAGVIYDDDDSAIVSLWDFGGQFVFYTTHQMFLSHRAIYILVTNLSQHIGDLVVDDEPYFDCSGTQSLRIEEFIDIWLNSIHGHSKSKKDGRAGEPPVLLVGTHADKLDQTEGKTEVMFEAIRYRFAGKPASLHFTDKDFGLNNAIEDPKLTDLRKKIIEVAEQQSYWGEWKPAKWIPFERLLEDLRKKGVEIIKRTVVEELNSNLPIPISSEEELDLFLRFQHEVANIMYFSLQELRDKIVLIPQFLVNALKSLITADMFCKKKPEILDSWKEFSQKGLLKPKLLDAVWRNNENTRFEENRDYILAIMEHLNIIARPVTYPGNEEVGDCTRIQEQDYFLVPCMLKEAPPSAIFQSEGEFISTPCLCLKLDNVAFPNAIFNRLLAGCMSRWPVARRGRKYLMYCGCGQFDVELQHRFTLSLSSNIIGLRIDRYCKTDMHPSNTICKNVYSMVQQTLQRIGEGLSLELSYKEYVKCPFGRKDSFECIYAVEDVKNCHEFPCYAHGQVEILNSCDMLKYWFDSEEFDQVQRSIDCQKNTFEDDDGQRDLLETNRQEPPTPVPVVEFKKRMDDTLDQRTLNELNKAMNSVGALVCYEQQTATVFRAGSKFIVTAAHSVASFLGPMSSGGLVNNPDVVVMFQYPLAGSEKPPFPNHLIERLVYYNPELDVAVLELKDPKTLPPKLALLHSEHLNFHVPLVHIIGYGHESNKKTLDPKCKVISPTDPSFSDAQQWLQMNKHNLAKYLRPDTQLIPEHWEFHGCDKKEKIIFSCYLEKGSSGAPILAFQNSYKPFIVGVVTNGLPYCFWQLNSCAQMHFPPEYRFEMGTRMSAIYENMIQSEPDLANDLFQQ